MILRSSIFAIVLISSACGLLSKKNADPTLKTISLHGTVHKPYCGGARPSPDIAAGYYESMTFEKYSILQGSNYSPGMKVYQEFTFDERGNTTLKLEVGDYMLLRSDKFLSLDEFMKKNGPYEEINFEVKDSECFKNWQNTVDLYFKVVNDTVIEMRQKAKCWIGTNPCLKYTGPPAQ